MSRIWFTSDVHYWHKNIAGAKVSQWKSGYRNFTDEREMSRVLVKQLNTYIADDDVLYYLGDWSFGGAQNIWNFRKQLRCRNIHLILGNHDGSIQKNIVLPNVYSTDDGVLIDGQPKPDAFDFEVNAQQLFTSVHDVLTVHHGKHTFFLSHYAHRVWCGSHKGIIHLYGHTHASIENKPYGKSMDVGIDNAYKLYKEYRPFSIEEICGIMDKREVLFVDHHNENTNVK